MSDLPTCPCSLKVLKNYKTHARSAGHIDFMQYGYHWKIPIDDGILFSEKFEECYFEIEVYSDIKKDDKLWFIDNTGLVYAVATFISFEDNRINYDTLYWIKYVDMQTEPITEITAHTCSDIIHIKRRPVKGFTSEYTNIITYLTP